MASSLALTGVVCSLLFIFDTLDLFSSRTQGGDCGHSGAAGDHQGCQPRAGGQGGGGPETGQDLQRSPEQSGSRPLPKQQSLTDKLAGTSGGEAGRREDCQAGLHRPGGQYDEEEAGGAGEDHEYH